MISSGLAFQAKGVGLEALYSWMKRLMADWRSTTEWKTLVGGLDEHYVV
jgi:hypothetical protein